MTRPLSRAIPFALLALILSALISAAVLLIMVGVPGSRDAAAEFQRQAITQAVTVDLVVGSLVLLLTGWLAARPLTGREAVAAGLMVGLVYILVDLAIVFLFGNADRLDLSVTGVSYVAKVAAGTLGGWIAGRGSSSAEPDEPVSLDKP
jgi:hypothetical protein